jgi:hypothetical protein
MKLRRWIFRCALVLVACSSALLAQRAGRRQGGAFNEFGMRFGQNRAPETELVLARWHYTAGWGGGGWAHDYPTAEEHILQIMKEATGINVDRLSYRILELSSPEIFNYPFSYVSEPGEMLLNDEEIQNLRQYIERGGFVMIDDFGGQGGGDREFQAFRNNLIRAFPDRDMFPLTEDSALLNIYYDIDNLQTVHPMTGVKSEFYGYNDSKGRLAMIICYANDVGDYWEFIDQPYYALKPSAEALKLGINFVMYSMTH